MYRRREQRAWIRLGKGKRLRILASGLGLSILLTGCGPLPMAPLAVPDIEWPEAAAQESGDDAAAGNTDAVITGFDSLPDEVLEQTVPLGTTIEELNLPDTLEAYVARGDVDNEGEGVKPPETSEDDKDGQDKPPGEGDDNNGGGNSDDGDNNGGDIPGESDSTSGGNDGDTGDDSNDGGNDGGEGDDSTGDGNDGGTGDDSNGDGKKDGSDDSQNDSEGNQGSDTPGEDDISGGGNDGGDNNGGETGDTSNDDETDDSAGGDEFPAVEDNEDTRSTDGGTGTDAPETSDSVDNRITAGLHVQTGSFVMPVYASGKPQGDLMAGTMTDNRDNTGKTAAPADSKGAADQTETETGNTTDAQENRVVIENVTWQSDPAYDGSVEGTYTFTAVLPDGYAFSESVSLPQITVTVGNVVIQALLERIAALPDAQEYLEKEPDIDNWEGDEDDYEEAYTEWMEGLYDYAREALAILEEIEKLTEEEQALIPREALDKLAAWAEIAEQLEENAMTMAATHTCNGITFDAWTSTNSLPTSGSYYLTDNVELDAGTQCIISAGNTLRLCLNGNTIQSREEKSNAIFNVKGGTLDLYDCTGTGKVYCTGFTPVSVCDGGSFNLYNGTVEQGGDLSAVAVVEGSNNTGGTVNIYGGRVKGGAQTNGGIGVNSNLINVSVTVQSGEITGYHGITISSGSLTITGGTITGETYYGVWVYDKGATTISGGEISGRQSGVRIGNNNGGGNLTVEGGTVTGVENYGVRVSGGGAAVRGGKVSGKSVGIMVQSGDLTVFGGTIKGGTSYAVWMLEEGRVSIAGNATLNTAIYSTNKNSIIASGTGQSGLSTVYRIKYSDGNVTNDQIIVQGSTDKDHYRLDSETFGLAASGGNLVAKGKYTVTYNTNSGTIADENDYTSYIYSDGLTLPKPTRTGYTFDGWYEDAGCTGAKVTSISTTEAGNKTYYAKWTPDPYTISYNLNGGALPDGKTNPTSYTVESSAVTLNNPIKTGYMFVGWSGTGLSGSNNTSVTIVKGSMGDRSYTANWTGNQYTIAYSGLDGADAFTPKPAKHIYGNSTTVGNPKKAGYTFAGWKVNNGSTATRNLTLGATAYTSAITLTATWTANTYKVAFDYQGATGGSNTASKNVIYNGTYGTLPTPTRTGYAFKGWFEAVNGTGDQIKNTTTVKITADQTLYACWKDAAAPDKPVLKSGVTIPTGWTETQTTIPLTLSDNEGVEELWVEIDNSDDYIKVGGFTGGSQTVEYSYPVSEGEHTYRFKAKDAVGNESPESDAITVKLDTTAPVIGELSYENKSATLRQWIIGKKDMVVHVPVTDNDRNGNAGSGVDKITYIMTPAGAEGTPDGGNAVTKTVNVKSGVADITFDGDFRGNITITCTDAVGNTADSKTVSASGGGVIVEDTKPVVTVALPQTPQPNADDWYSETFDITVTVTDDKQAQSAAVISGGIAKITWKDGENGTEQTVVGLPGTAPVYSKIFTIPVGMDGMHTYYVQAVDNAGNESGWESVTVKLDRGSPVFSGEPVAKNVTPESADIIFTPSEGGKVYWIVDPEGMPGNAQTVVSGAQDGAGQGGTQEITGGAAEGIPVTDLTSGAVHKVYVVLEDIAGNLSEVKEIVFSTQRETPVITADDLIKDYEKEKVKVPDDFGNVEVYTDPDDPSGSIITPGDDGFLPVNPGKSVYIRYPEKTEGGVTVPPSAGVKVDIPARPAAPPAKEVTVTGTAVTVKNPADGEEYILLEKGSLPEGAEPDWDNTDKVNETGAFTGLDPNKEYDLYVRKKATEDDFASESAKTPVRTYVMINEPQITGEGAGEDGNTAPKPDKPDEGGATVTYTGTYEEEYTPVIIVDGKEIIPGAGTSDADGSEMTWNEEDGVGEWKYVYPIPDGVSETGITVTFRNRAVTGITAQPEHLMIFADDAANRGAVQAGNVAPLTACLKEKCSVKAVYDNRTTGEVPADNLSYATTDSLEPKGGSYRYTVSANGKSSGISLTVTPVEAAVTAPTGLIKTRKADGYTAQEVGTWLPAQVMVSYTGTGYSLRREERTVTWNTGSLGSDFGVQTGTKIINGTVELPAWATGEDTVSMEIEFVDRNVLGDNQMRLTQEGFVYGKRKLPNPGGSVTVRDTNPSYTYLYSADGGTTWVLAESLTVSTSGYVVPGEYRVKMAYMGDSYMGTKEVSFTVTKKKLKINKGTLEAVSRNYDGTTDARLKEGGEAVLSDMVEGDDVTPGGTLEARFAEKGPKRNIPVSVTGFQLQGADADCYELADTKITLYATINKEDGTPPSGGSSGNGSSGGDNSGSGDNNNSGGDSSGNGNNSNSGDNSGNDNGGSTKPGEKTDGKKPDGETDGMKSGEKTDGTKPVRGIDGTDADSSTKPGGAGGSERDSTGTKPGDGSKPGEGGARIVPAVIEGGKIVIEDGSIGGGNNGGDGEKGREGANNGSGTNGGKIATGNVPGMANAGSDPQNGMTVGENTMCTMLKAGEGAVIVKVVCEEPELTAGVADTVAVANAVLTAEQMQLVNGGGTIEIRVEVKNITESVSGQEREMIESALARFREEQKGITVGMYVDISMFIKVGEGEWETVTTSDELIEVVVGIPEELRADGRKYYIIRFHEGECDILTDMDDVSDTITISTDRFSSYAIAYVATDGAGAGGVAKCGLCHICPTFQGICCFVWLTMIIEAVIIVMLILRRKQGEPERAR